MMARHKANHIQVAYATDATVRRQCAARQGRDGPRAGHQGESLRHAEGREGMEVTDTHPLNNLIELLGDVRYNLGFAG